MSSLDVRAIDEKDLRKAAPPATKQEFRVFLSEQAFDRAVARGDGDTTREIGGVLVGELLRDDAGPYLRIDTTVDALHAEEKGAELTFTHATWEHIHKEMDGKHKDKRVVGWYHTHPGFGIFLSDRDQFIQKSFFNLPFQVALVYDPKSREHGVFTWHDNEAWRARRYWVGAREQSWDGPRSAPDKLTDKAKPKSAKADGKAGDGDADAKPEARDDSLTGSLGSLIVIGLFLLVIGGFVGHWFGVGSANQALAGAEIEVAKAKMEGAQITAASLQSDLVGVMRATMGDEALHRPVEQAISDLDRVIAVLPAPPPPAVIEPAPVAGSGARAPGTPAPAAGSAAAGSAAPAPGSAASAVVPAAAPSPIDIRLAQLSIQLRAARDDLFVVRSGRQSAAITLRNLELATRRTGELRADLVHDVADQRAGLGLLYSELAADVVKAGDRDRARRLLATAAHVDPGNRARYEKQLQTFDKTASLPRDSSDNTESAGSAGQGSVR
jgi:proteasome lid subunit RPN8/RPN11